MDSLLYFCLAYISVKMWAVRQLLQNCLVFMNTLMVQEVLYDNNKYLLNKMTPEDFRGLTPLFYNHINPYGAFKLNMNQRIPIKLKIA